MEEATAKKNTGYYDFLSLFCLVVKSPVSSKDRYASSNWEEAGTGENCHQFGYERLLPMRSRNENLSELGRTHFEMQKPERA